MKNGKIHLLDLDFEYKLWKKRLELFIKEVEIIKLRNDELTSSNSDVQLAPEELVELEEHENDIRQLLNRFKTQEEEFQYYNKDFPITQSHTYYTEHMNLRKKMLDISERHLHKMADLAYELGI